MTWLISIGQIPPVSGSQQTCTKPNTRTAQVPRILVCLCTYPFLIHLCIYGFPNESIKFLTILLYRFQILCCSCSTIVSLFSHTYSASKLSLLASTSILHRPCLAPHDWIHSCLTVNLRLSLHQTGPLALAFVLRLVHIEIWGKYANKYIYIYNQSQTSVLLRTEFTWTQQSFKTQRLTSRSEHKPRSVPLPSSWSVLDWGTQQNR